MNSIVEEDMQDIVSQEIDWERFRNKTVLITGGSGFIAGYMVQTLAYLNQTQDMNIKIICLARNKAKAEHRFEGIGQIELILQDICDPIQYEGNVDFLIHAASPAAPKMYKEDPITVIKSNTIGTLNALDFAKAKGVESFLYFSAGAVYGIVDDEHIPFKEDFYGFINPTETSACYSSSKHCGEVICNAYFRLYGMPIKIVRPSHTYGPYIPLNDGKMYADFINNVLNNQDIELHTEGTDTRDFLYISDATALYFKILLNGRDGDAYNSGTGVETSIKDIATIITQLYPEKNLNVVFNINSSYTPIPNHRACNDITKIKAEFNFKWKYDVPTGFKRTIDSFLNSEY